MVNFLRFGARKLYTVPRSNMKFFKLYKKPRLFLIVDQFKVDGFLTMFYIIRIFCGDIRVVQLESSDEVNGIISKGKAS